MSTFSSMSSALSSLTAQRAALDVAGQNVANANTVGYTRQRAELSSVSSVTSASMFSKGLTVGQGVGVTGVSRLGNLFADIKVYTTTGSAGFMAQRAATLAQLESNITEPSDNGLSNQLSGFWNAWHDVGNNPDVAAPGQVLIEAAKSLTHAIGSGYRAVETQWQETRTQAEALVTEVNATATSIAELNQNIRSILVSGGNANELMDQRDLMITSLSELTGATMRANEDGTVNVSIGGNPIVSGTTAYSLSVAGARQMHEATTDAPRIVWDRSGAGTAALDGGILGAMVSVLAPATSTRTGGILAEAAASYNALAEKLASSVNDLHTTGRTTAGDVGGNFFGQSADPTLPPALGITVAVTDPKDIAAAAAGAGALDSSVADAIAQIAKATGGPDRMWAAFVVEVGVKAQSSLQSAKVSEVARNTAVTLQLSQTSVDIDEETVQMLAFQRAFQGASRVLTAVDEMLDTLINRTGVVGR